MACLKSDLHYYHVFVGYARWFLEQARRWGDELQNPVMALRCSQQAEESLSLAKLALAHAV